MPFLQQVTRTRPRFATKGLLRVSLALVGGLALMAFWSSISLPLGSLSLILGGLALWPRTASSERRDDATDSGNGVPVRELVLAALGVLIALQLLG